MADLNKTTASHAQPFSGAFGNNSVAIFEYTCNTVAINDVIYLGRLPKYSKVHSVKLINEAFGVGTTIDVGYATAEIGGTLTADDNYWLSAIDVTSAATTAAIASAVPVTFTEEVYVTATAEAVQSPASNKKIYVVVEYLYENN
jgi:hypothetical protein